MKKVLLLCMAISFLCTSHLFASTFTEDFEGGLGNWTGINEGVHHGVIVVDPLNLNGNNYVLGFTTNIGGGDIFTTNPVFAAGEYRLKFDFLGILEDGVTDAGGYLGISQGFAGSHTWLFSTGGVSGSNPILVDDGSWHSYNRTFVAASDFHLMLEDFVAPGMNAYFDNFELSPVPEPATMLLFGIGLLGLAGVNRRKK